MNNLMVDTEAKDWWRTLDLSTLNSIELCNHVSLCFDDVVESLNAQINAAQLKAQQGNDLVDEDWYRAALSAQSHAKKKRKELNMRRDGMLKAQNAKIGKEKQDIMERIATHLENVAAILVKIEAKL